MILSCVRVAITIWYRDRIALMSTSVAIRNLLNPGFQLSNPSLVVDEDHLLSSGDPVIVQVVRAIVPVLVLLEHDQLFKTRLRDLLSDEPDIPVRVLVVRHIRSETRLLLPRAWLELEHILGGRRPVLDQIGRAHV